MRSRWPLPYRISQKPLTIEGRREVGSRGTSRRPARLSSRFSRAGLGAQPGRLWSALGRGRDGGALFPGHVQCALGCRSLRMGRTGISRRFRRRGLRVSWWFSLVKRRSRGHLSWATGYCAFRLLSDFTPGLAASICGRLFYHHYRKPTAPSSSRCRLVGPAWHTPSQLSYHFFCGSRLITFFVHRGPSQHFISRLSLTIHRC